MTSDRLTGALERLPHSPGVYLMRDRAGMIIYVGKAIDLRKRVAHYFRADLEDPKTRALMVEVQHVDYIAAESEREALLIEQRLIHRHQPLYNVMWKDGKSYPYVKLTLQEDFPRLYLTRQRRRDGALYFGPFPNTRGVRRLLEWAWKKKVLALRPCDLEIREGNPWPFEKVRHCLYLHTGQCPAPCVGRVSKEGYAQTVERAKLFFEGKNRDLRHAMEQDMRAAAEALDFERAAQLRDNVEAISHINERVTFRAMREEDVQGRLEATQALQDLQKVLELPRPPWRMECFDISHIQGTETVASLVTFQGGRPWKSGYRKFIVRTVPGVDDFASMAEVVGRRYQRLKNEKSAWPDLVLIDGGLGQLSAAVASLKKVTPRTLPLASLAKREEEIFIPGRKNPIKLDRHSPALQLLQYIRDEAHRFAIGFHRHRRDKGLFEPNPTSEAS